MIIFFYLAYTLKIHYFVHFYYRFLFSYRNFIFNPVPKILYLIRVWQIVYFNILHTSNTSSNGYSLLLSNIIWIYFCIVVEFLITRFIKIINIFYIINAPFKVLYQHNQKKNFWSPGFLFMYWTCNISLV